jgi:hypothetical protein
LMLGWWIVGGGIARTYEPPIQGLSAELAQVCVR